jgi:hypothetical protein
VARPLLVSLEPVACIARAASDVSSRRQTMGGPKGPLFVGPEAAHGDRPRQPPPGAGLGFRSRRRCVSTKSP